MKSPTSWHVGECNPRAKLTFEQVEQIRNGIARGETNVTLGNLFGVSPATISDIRVGRRWGGGRGQRMDPGPAKIRRNRAARDLREARRLEGLCTVCGDPTDPPYRICSGCRSYERLTRLSGPL